ncbi:MAG: glycosyltransferase [Ilumatobacteraceae bacterium]
MIARATDLLDTDWYERRYPDVVASGLTAVEHFDRHGFFEGRDPNPLFNTDWYRHHHDVASDRNCLQHYLVEGHQAGLEPSIYFDSEWYRSQAGRLDADRSPLEHYWSIGWRHCHDPHPLFDAVWYLGQRPRGLGVGMVPYVHFLSFGVHEGLPPSPLFDPNAYLDLNSDVAEAGAEPFTHFLSWGRHEGRLTSELVDPDFYKLQYPDDLLVHKWGSEAHFARFGWSENREISRDPLANRIMRFVAERAHSSRRFATSHEFGGTSIDPIDWGARADAVVVRGYENPRVSIIIPTLDHADDVIRCVESISRLPDTTSSRIVVVDDGSSEEQHRLLTRLRGVDLVRMEQNTGFAGACKAGVDSTSTEFILLLNNDTEVLPGWLDALVAEMDTNSRTGIAGSMVLRADCRLQEAGGIVWSDGTAWHYASGQSPIEGFARYRREVDYCSGASLIVRRGLWDLLGGFSPEFAPAYYEDTDLCLSAWSQNCSVVYKPNSIVIHREGSSHGRGSFGLKRRQYVNREKFVNKWKSVIKNSDKPEFSAQCTGLRERDRRTNAHVLVCDHQHLDPNADSGSVRMNEILEALLRRGNIVHFYATGSLRNQKWVDSASARGIEILQSGSQLEPFLVSHREQLDLIIVSRPSAMAAVMSDLALYAPQVPVAYDMVDAHALRLHRKADISGLPEDREVAEHVAAVERRAVLASDIVIGVSERDVDFAESLLDGSSMRSVVISNVHRTFDAGPPFGARSGILFVGSFLHDPNVDAVKFFVSEVLPKVKGRLGEVEFLVAGSYVTDEVKSLHGSGVNVLGWVENLASVYESVRLVVAPLRYGAGVKGKIGEALSHHVPVITTGIGVEGMPLVPGEDVLVADSPEGLVEAIVKAYSDETTWQRLSSCGARAIEEHLGLRALDAALEQLFREVNRPRSFGQ